VQDTPLCFYVENVEMILVSVTQDSCLYNWSTRWME